MPAPKPIRLPGRRRSRSQQAVIAAAAAAFLALALLTLHIFVSSNALQIAALWVLGGGLSAAWIAILTWRIPVYDRRHLTIFGAIWAVGIAISVLLVLLSVAARSVLWARSVQWLALTLSNTLGALFLRALLRVRTSPILGRLLSLISPIAILLLIVVLSFQRA